MLLLLGAETLRRDHGGKTPKIRLSFEWHRIALAVGGCDPGPDPLTQARLPPGRMGERGGVGLVFVHDDGGNRAQRLCPERASAVGP